MKSKINYLVVSFILSLSLIGLSSSAEAYYRDGQRQAGYYHNGHYYGHSYKYRHGKKCWVVKGYWRNGYWRPARTVCR